MVIIAPPPMTWRVLLHPMTDRVKQSHISQMLYIFPLEKCWGFSICFKAGIKVIFLARIILILPLLLKASSLLFPAFHLFQSPLMISCILHIQDKIWHQLLKTLLHNHPYSLWDPNHLEKGLLDTYSSFKPIIKWPINVINYSHWINNIWL